LINTQSLLGTASDATDIRPCYVKGFRREFNLWNPRGWTRTNLELKGIPYCAVDISKVSDPEAKVNGVIFTVHSDDLVQLIEREYAYKLVGAAAYDFETGESIGECSLFSACKNDGKYTLSEPAQAKYLEVCMEGAKQYGEAFYKEFLRTTYIGDKRLSEMPEITG
jgi:hypothetical protein